MLSAICTTFGLALAAYLIFSRRLATSSDWKATVVPLASIMGSGFLVSAPLLASVVGTWAVAWMAGLLVLAYAVGGAIRFNIRHFEPIEHRRGFAQSLAFLSRLVLAGAYFTSVSYYLQLLAAFALHPLGISSPVMHHAFVTVVLATIGSIGMSRGLGKLEQAERYTVGLNLGVIGALLLALSAYNIELVVRGQWVLPQLTTHAGTEQIRVVLGLLIIVQGFETSRFLGDKHSPEQRIRTMRIAQRLSSIIYLCFLGLATVLFRNGLNADVTAIIEMTAPVALALPILLNVAAIGSQFSASVADFTGSGGLLEDISDRKLSLRHAYGLALAVTVVLTWQTDVTEIIAYASRAFALFYALQGMTAFAVAHAKTDLPQRGAHLLLFAVVTLLTLAVFLFGAPAT